MSTFSAIGRAVAGAAAALTISLAGCGSSVPKDDVATSIKAELDKQNVGSGPVTCPADLKAEVGQSLRCEFEVGGQPVEAVATITSLQGSTANYDIVTQARPVAKALLGQKVGEQLEQNAITVDSSDCAGDLQPRVGESVTCTVRSGGETLDLTVTVTSVDGGLINYQIEQT